MKSRYINIIIMFMLAFVLWTCQDTQPPAPANGVTTTVAIQGRVIDLKTANTISGASVLLTAPGRKDSVLTTIDGTFLFLIKLDNNSSVNVTLTIRKTGYIGATSTLSVSADTSILFTLDINPSTFANITGRIRDYRTSYPLRNTTVGIIGPGFLDSVLTSTDGLYRFSIDMVDVDSLPVLVTYRKAGYKAEERNIVIRKGQRALPDVLLRIDAGSNVAQVLGRVLDKQSGVTLYNASVYLNSSVLTDSVTTSGDGSFSFTLNLQGLSSVSGTVNVKKNGYRSNSFLFSVQPGQSLSNNVMLDRDTVTSIRDSSGSGLAHSIALVSLTKNEIDVYGVGGTESAIITWEVRDSLGFPIDYDHRDTVLFSLIGTPVQGGAYVLPNRAITNSSGRVATTVNSGTVAGELQFVASLRREVDGVTITSRPINITVNAGLPDQAHFTLAPSVYNFAAYDWVGRIDMITCLVGDKYTNQVKAGTAVYFNSTGGVMDATGFTDKWGFAMSPKDNQLPKLFSGNPLPNDPILGVGFARLAAMTRGENGVFVADTIVILFSGTAMIRNVSVDSFSVPRGGKSQRIYYTVSDRFGHPLAGGTLIAVSLQYTPPPNSQINLTTNGDVNIRLADSQLPGPGTTLFWFEVVDQTVGGVSSRIPVNAVIQVGPTPNLSDPNDKIYYSVPGFIGN